MSSEFEAKIDKVKSSTQKLEVAMRTAFLWENIQLHTVMTNFRTLIAEVVNHKNELEQYSSLWCAQNMLKDSTLSSLQVYLNKVNFLLERPDIDLRWKDLVTFDYGVYRRNQKQ
jgi:hypothetical protein